MSKTKRIKFVEPKLELFDNIAIIGSSGILMDLKLGDTIDGYKEVIRFNRAPTKGYETHVGSRTTLRVINHHVATNQSYSKEENMKGFWLGQPSDFIKNLRNSRLLHYGAGISKKERCGNIHKSIEFYIFKGENKNAPCRIPGEIKRISVGTGFVVLCVVSEIIPVLFGFNINDRCRDHYWEKRPDDGFSHNIIKEKEYLKKLIQEGKIKLGHEG